MSTNKLEPEQIKAFKEKEAEVFKAAEKEFEEDGFIDNRPIEWFADEVFSAGDKEWGLEILQKMEVFAKEYFDLVGTMERLLKLKCCAMLDINEDDKDDCEDYVDDYLSDARFSVDKNLFKEVM
jgi:hypothetical protein